MWLLSSVIIKSSNWKPPSSTFQQLAKRKKRAIITIEEPNVSLVYASENVKVSTIENEEEESSKTGMYFWGFVFCFLYNKLFVFSELWQSNRNVYIIVKPFSNL